jgi:hypothetical protein
MALENASPSSYLTLPSSRLTEKRPGAMICALDPEKPLLQAPAPITASVDVPGGETLPFAAMLARTLARQAPGARLWRVPTWLFRLGLALAGKRVPPAVSATGFVGRLNRDQVFDAGPAQRLLGRALRPFEP